MSESIKVSVIVPVYNAEKYLERCLDSLVNQTIDSYEILAIDDGSKDGSWHIIERYQQEYPQIVRGYTKANSGVSETRNFGVSEAKGEYIGFVDSDDYVDFDYYERMYDRAVEEDADVVSSPVTYVRGDRIEKRYYNKKRFGRPAIEDPYILIRGNAYCPNKIYRRSFWQDNGLRFENQWFEDSRLLYILMLKANKVSCVNIPFYHYVTTVEDSAVKLVGSKVFDIFKSTDDIISYYKSIGKFEEENRTVEFLVLRHLFPRVEALHRGHDRKTAKSFVKELISYLNTNFPDWRESEYFDVKEDADNQTQLRASALKDDAMLMRYAGGSSLIYSLMERSAAGKDRRQAAESASAQSAQDSNADGTGAAGDAAASDGAPDIARFGEMTVHDVRSVLGRAGFDAGSICAEITDEGIVISVQADPLHRMTARIALERAGYELTGQDVNAPGAAVCETYRFADKTVFSIRYSDPQYGEGDDGKASSGKAVRHYDVSYTDIKRRTREMPEPVLFTDTEEQPVSWDDVYAAADRGYDPVVIAHDKKTSKMNRHPRVRCYRGDAGDAEFTEKIRARVAGDQQLRTYEQLGQND